MERKRNIFGFLKKRKVARLFISICYSVILFTCLLIWNYSGLHLALNESFFKIVHLINAVTLRDEALPFDKTQLLFVDVSERLEVIENSNSSANYAISDRKALIKLFKLLKNNCVPDSCYIICDLYFNKKSQSDSELEKAIKEFPHFFSALLDDDGKTVPNILRAGVAAPSGIDITSGSLLDFSSNELSYRPVSQSNAYTLPLVLFESYNERHIVPRGFYYQSNNAYYLNTIEICPYIDRDALLEPSYEGYTTQNNISGNRNIDYFKIDALLTDVSDSRSLKKLSRKKLIVIGDFKNDLHKTMAENMPGPLVIFNVFIALQMERNKITLFNILLMLSFFTSVIYIEIYLKNNKRLRPYHRWLRSMNGRFAIEVSVSILLIWIASFLNYFLFNSSLDVVVGTILVTAIAYIHKRSTKYLKKPVLHS
ncbi:hypothetical protein [Mucilaginibacter sp. OK098]|uniref:hypothetical protein n=1 Tax=Mucilaginibacter sp. OK098 TaxID=1855297 RepID=UPI0009143386|nr:hypothetical protein [Mucilaginibacter sp. OK098]SHM13915.1 hypothetical protein SAMN05216524_101939 [Mucilaginibacter sp. OK098]